MIDQKKIDKYRKLQDRVAKAAPGDPEGQVARDLLARMEAEYPGIQARAIVDAAYGAGAALRADAQGARRAAPRSASAKAQKPQKPATSAIDFDAFITAGARIAAEAAKVIEENLSVLGMVNTVQVDIVRDHLRGGLRVVAFIPDRTIAETGPSFAEFTRVLGVRIGRELREKTGKGS